MRTRSLGNTSVQISVVGFGAMALSLRNRPSDDESVRIVEQVLAAGVNLVDTADTYCLGPSDVHHNEQIVSRGIADYPSPVVVATKGGTRRTDHGWQVDGAPDRLYRSICDSYESLGGRHPIPLWQL